jgi:hypothetical protein
VLPLVRCSNCPPPSQLVSSWLEFPLRNVCVLLRERAARRVGAGRDGNKEGTAVVTYQELRDAAGRAVVSRPFPSWNRSMLTEIYLCHACFYQEILRTETPGQEDSKRLQVAAESALERTMTLRASTPGSSTGGSSAAAGYSPPPPPRDSHSPPPIPPSQSVADTHTGAGSGSGSGEGLAPAGRRSWFGRRMARCCTPAPPPHEIDYDHPDDSQSAPPPHDDDAAADMAGCPPPPPAAAEGTAAVPAGHGRDALGGPAARSDGGEESISVEEGVPPAPPMPDSGPPPIPSAAPPPLPPRQSPEERTEI